MSIDWTTIRKVEFERLECIERAVRNWIEKQDDGIAGPEDWVRLKRACGYVVPNVPPLSTEELIAQLQRRALK